MTSVKLAADSSKILSCSADRYHLVGGKFFFIMLCSIQLQRHITLSSSRSLVFRDALITDDSIEISHHLHQTASQGTVYDMVVDSKMEIAVTVGQVSI